MKLVQIRDGKCKAVSEVEGCIEDNCPGMVGETVIITIAVTSSLLLLSLLICLAILCCRRWIHSRFIKTDINNDYGIYPENGDYVVAEAVDRNTNYEASGKDEAIRRQISENEYDKMYEDQVNKHENEYDSMYN